MLTRLLKLNNLLVSQGWDLRRPPQGDLVLQNETRADLERVAAPRGPRDIRPTVPPLEVLAARATEINRLLREARIKDEYRPAVVAAVMLALWRSKGDIRRDPHYILRDVNDACRDAFVKAGKADLAISLRVDEANDKLKEKARRITTILERLNITVLTAEHDYLGQLYETFVRYTGGNTIGQYFTPRHITRLMADTCQVTKDDIVLDPACGTGGFLVACMDRILREHHLSRAQMGDIIKRNLIGFEDEPVTAALCLDPYREDIEDAREDEYDAAVARARLLESEGNPDVLIGGADLRKRLSKLLSSA